MSLILDKFDVGIALLKRNGDGEFKKLGTIESIDANGDVTYTQTNCP